MWQASADMPKPTISAWMCAPRACAASSGSSTSMAAPSPRIMPRRSLENGRQVSGDTTRMASQAFRMPKLKGASLPPVIARSVIPAAHHPISLPDGVARRRAGRRDGEAGTGNAELHRDVAGARVGHRLGNGQRVHAVVAELVDLLEADILGALPAHARAGDDGRSFAQLGCPLHARILHGLARGDHRELRETVDEIGAAIFEVRLVAVAAHFGAVLKSELT